MSNINNHGVSMNKIELSPHLQELSCENAAAIQGGSSVRLFGNTDFGDELWNTQGIANNPTIPPHINDEISSIIIDSGTVDFYTDENFQGQKVTLGPGSYSWVEDIGIPDDSISSFREAGL